MKEMIFVYNMVELSPKKRAMIIIKLGRALNYQIGANWTEAVVYELVSILDPENNILEMDEYKHAK